MSNQNLQDFSKFFVNPKERFINRELSWIAFNTRVLEEACNTRNPLFERIRFLSISASNLDEFTMVRVAGIMDQIRHGVIKHSKDGLSATEQLTALRKETKHLILNQHRAWLELVAELRKNEVNLISAYDLCDEDLAWVEDYFFSNIFPALTPLSIDPAHPFPFLPTKEIALVFELQNKQTRRIMRTVIPLPQKLERLILFPGSSVRFMLIEDIVSLFLKQIFPECHLKDQGIFQLIRDSDIEVEEESEDLVQHYESAVKQRRRGRVIQLKISRSMPESLRHFVMEELQVLPEDILVIDGLVGLDRCVELLKCDRQDLLFSKFDVRFPERIIEFGGDCFAAIESKDIIIHHPYESFDVVVQFLRQAARDPDVVAIKQTLYRTSSDSPIVKALIEAAEAGKSVTAVVELSARFDEEANIRWARDLERAGAHVTYGFVSLKTHAKISLVVRRVANQMQSYVHFGTGNYHPITARTYSDLSFFTNDPDLCKDASYLFNYLTGYSVPESFNKISVAPLTLRGDIKALIEKEIAYAKGGKPATIWCKLNALVDGEIIDHFYKASQAGVHIELIVRGICCLRPGIPGLSDNIRVKSIVGRFLEHARIYCFGDGQPMPSAKTKVFIASSDLMERNLNRRIEVMVPIENPTVHEQVLEQIMVSNVSDLRQSWILHPDGSYERMVSKPNDFCAQEFFMNNPSLSGRGKALKDKKPLQPKLNPST